MHVTLTETTPEPRAIQTVPPETTTERFPFRRDIALAESKLIDLGYDDETTAKIIADIRRCGTAWCSPHFHEAAELEHALAVEDVLDDHADWNRQDWGQVYPDRSQDRFAGSRGCAGLALRGWAR